jgi:transposase
MRAIEVRKDISATEVRKAAKRESSSAVCRRMLGMAHLVEGGSRLGAQEIACLTVNVFRTWIRRFNAQGIKGLISKKSPGRPVKMSHQIELRLKKKVLDGPTKDEGLVRYRIVDLQEFLKKECSISMCGSGIWYKLQSMDLSWKTGRQRNPNSSREVQEAFKKTLSKS